MCHYVDLQMTQCELGIGPFDDAYILAAERSRAWLFVLNNEFDLNCTSLECVLFLINLKYGYISTLAQKFV